MNKYEQIIPLKLLDLSKSQSSSPSQIIQFNSVHAKTLLQTFQVNSSFFHRVLSPYGVPCSNECLLSLACSISPSVFKIPKVLSSQIPVFDYLVSIVDLLQLLPFSSDRDHWKEFTPNMMKMILSLPGSSIIPFISAHPLVRA